MRSIEDAIDALGSLQPGWDSYSSSEIGLLARQAAKELVSRIALALGPECGSPIVSPTPDGGVALIWRRNGGQLKVEAFCSQNMCRFAVLRSGKVEHAGPIVDSDSFVTQILTRYISV